MTPKDVDQLLRPVLLKDLRVICRARGLSPAGSKETLEQALKEHMLATGDFSLRADDDYSGLSAVGSASEKQMTADRDNNYARPGGAQNLGNHLTGRNSSRVLAPPGGVSQISFGDYTPGPTAAQHYQQPQPQDYPPQQQQQQQQYGGGGGGGPPAGRGPGVSPRAGQVQFGGPDAPPNTYHTASGAYGNTTDMSSGGGSPGQTGPANNNYQRPNGMQNVGNFLTDRPSSRVLAPPGGKSQISFG